MLDGNGLSVTPVGSIQQELRTQTEQYQRLSKVYDVHSTTSSEVSDLIIEGAVLDCSHADGYRLAIVQHDLTIHAKAAAGVRHD